MKKSAAPLDRLDRRASHQFNGKRNAWWIRAIGAASDIGDPPQLRLLCASVITLGVLYLDGKLAKTGMRMLAAYTPARWTKSRAKGVIDRTRPESEADDYKDGVGDSHAHSENLFPSGHSASIVAIAQAFARNYPDHAIAGAQGAARQELHQRRRSRNGDQAGGRAGAVDGGPWRSWRDGAKHGVKNFSNRPP